MLDKSRHLLEKIVKFISHPNFIRRRGVLGTIRNCLFDKNNHSCILDELDILPLLFDILRGPEEFKPEELEGMPENLKYVSNEKERDSDPECRAMAVDCLLLLTSTLNGRETLRKKRTYEIIREYDNVETDELIKERIIHIITLLKGLDEPNDNEVNINPIDVISNQSDDLFEKMKQDLNQNETKEKPKPKIIDDPIEFDEYGEQIEVI